jgi:Pyruvate/2-oxoglutarate dehydrogenase complex, dihydrolipoamide dehydrogenase (E3) component, and related enzymes
VLDSDGVLSMKSLPSSVSIIGGGVIGVEFGVLLSELGCSVNIIEMFDEILINLDQDIVKKAYKMLEKNKIHMITGAKVLKIDSGKVVYDNKDGVIQTLQSEKVLLAAGRIPNTDKNELDRLGIKHNNGRIETNDRMQTNVDGIYAIGDVNGKFMLAHVASVEGMVAAENIAGYNSKMDYKAIPQCIYTHPEIACVGMTEKEARENGFNVKTGKFPLNANGKSVAEGETDGMVKIISDEGSGEILGVHIICPHATDMISESVLAMNLEATIKEIANTIHPHPTVSEAVMEAAEAITGGAIHMVRNE